MNTIAIIPEIPGQPDATFLAISGHLQAKGSTPGQALDALTAQLGSEQGTLLVIQSRRPDDYFSKDQIDHLSQLMSKWRTARDHGKDLDARQAQELEELVEAELQAAIKRAQALKNPA